MFRRRIAIRALLTMTLSLLLAPGLCSEQKPLRTLRLPDQNGVEHHTADWKKRRATVLVFLGAECPVSNHYVPTLIELHNKFHTKDLAILGVHADPEIDGTAAKKHAAEFGLPFVTLLDAKQELARALGVRIVPTAVVLNSRGEVCYLGRIDDRYAANGRRRDEPTSHDLKMALEAVLRGEMPSVRATVGFGCPLPALKK
jgi:peroxiredoxin